MQTVEGRVTEIQMDPGGATVAWIACPRKAIPSPGQYTLAWSPEDVEAPLATPLFPGETAGEGFLAASPIPRSWEPGSRLFLSGPLGNGFKLPPGIKRLALAALGDSAARLLPLIAPALAQNTDIALFTGGPLPALPVAVEVHLLGELSQAIAWADFLAIDLVSGELPNLRRVIGLTPEARLPCPAQALILAPMPCGGQAECGACAVSTRRSYSLACKDGPVFDLEMINW